MARIGGFDQPLCRGDIVGDERLDRAPDLSVGAHQGTSTREGLLPAVVLGRGQPRSGARLDAALERSRVRRVFVDPEDIGEAPGLEARNKVLPHEPCRAGNNHPLRRLENGHIHSLLDQILVRKKEGRGSRRITAMIGAPEAGCRPRAAFGGRPARYRRRPVRAHPKRTAALKMRGHRRVNEARLDVEHMQVCAVQAMG